MSKMLQALLVKKVNGRLQVSGPKTSNDLQGITDLDMVLILADYREMSKAEYKEQLSAFEAATDKSRVAEDARRLIKHVRPISYVLGSLFLEDVKDFVFDGLDYRE